MKKDYNQIALMYAQQFGILDYKVKGKYMIFNQNYINREFVGTWISKPCTYQRKVNLDTLKTETIKLKRTNRNGWNNTY